MKGEVRKRIGEGGMWLNNSQPALLELREVEEILQTSATRGLSTHQAAERSVPFLMVSVTTTYFVGEYGIGSCTGTDYSVPVPYQYKKQAGI
jgi:hypothetical protein